MEDFAIVLTTTDSSESAQRIARTLVERRLAACVNILPLVESVYRWKAIVESAQELLLIIKTRASRFADVESAIRELHHYDLPECILVPIEQGSADYLKWISENVQP
jgi:periplasmic divalent cation tolerance protein